ncbi:hypothetical protein H2200_003849 [Cladophialophora chaetospira]|uniref:F-box domain-containing protein n=1 Tax=Cladophialophora chaetospira TaxID=386627 RepID=A0AA38XF61_9EURO|nr:hypothetical protein H2200_003849 [Cladophialophora chaetospira]
MTSSAPPPVVTPQREFDEMGQSQSETSSSNATKGPAKITVTEQFLDNRRTPRLSLSSPSTMIGKAKRHASMSMSTSLSTNKGRALHGAQQSPFLSILPHDVHHLLATHYVDFDTLLALRQTCRTLHQILTPGLVRRIRCKIVKESLDREISQYRDYRSVYPRQRLGHLWDLLYAAFDFRLIERPSKELRCYGCLEVKPLWCFVERMSNRGTGLGAKSAKDRMCKDCMRRYRDIEGEWWKENWIKKSDTVRKSSKSRRVSRFILQGGSLVNPEEEVGVCSLCGSGTFELWWGCVGCFEVEEQRRREEDMKEFDGAIERKLVDFLESWRVRKEAKRRKKQASRDRRTRTRKWWYSSLNTRLGGNLADRKAALMEWKDSKGTQKPGTTAPNFGTRDQHWRALDQIPLTKSRREARCSSCWVPNCPRRTYILGLAYERPLPRERWCPGCQQDYNQRLARKEERKLMALKAKGNQGLNSIFSDDWNDGFGGLFDET